MQPRQGEGGCTPANLLADLTIEAEVQPRCQPRLSQGSALAAAIRYGLRHWEDFCRFLDDGALELNMKGVEREIRPIVVTRKAAFVDHPNHRRVHESLDNLTPADVYSGQGRAILLERERIKRQTILQRRLLHHSQAA